MAVGGPVGPVGPVGPGSPGGLAGPDGPGGLGGPGGQVGQEGRAGQGGQGGQLIRWTPKKMSLPLSNNCPRRLTGNDNNWVRRTLRLSMTSIMI